MTVNCALCLQTGFDKHLIDISAIAAKQLNISKILHQHLPNYFKVKPTDGHVCRKCWHKVNDFHEFLVNLDKIHANKCTASADVTSDSSNDGEALELNETESNGATEPTGVDDVTATKEKERIPCRAFLCPHCGTKYPSYILLYRHIRRLHDIKAFQCKVAHCVESFDTQKMLDEHSAKSHIRIECPHCKKSIEQSELDEHVKQKHNPDNSVICDVCAKISPSASAHAAHYRVQHVVQEKIQCEQCGDWLRNKESLRRHMDRHRQGPQTCPICGHISPNRNALGLHKKKHVPELMQRYKCQDCGKGFRDSVKFKEHTYTHTGITDAYQCNHCPKTFRFSSMMYKHRKKEHPDEERERIRDNVNYNPRNRFFQ